jgi:uncharacterized protein with von Willebrand factor type A (vWA) domain
VRTWSDLETIAEKDFAEFSEEEIAFAQSALETCWNPGERRTRHWRPGCGRSVTCVGPGAQRENGRRRGEAAAPPLSRVPAPSSFCAMSGSMERYSRMPLHFVHAMGRRTPEAFLFTQLTRITRQVRGRPLARRAAVPRSA